MARSGKCRCFAFSVQMVGEVYAHAYTYICYRLASSPKLRHLYDYGFAVAFTLVLAGLTALTPGRLSKLL